MQYTRKQIVAYLKNNHTASVSDLSQALTLTLGNIRHHLKELEASNIIEKVDSQPSRGRGRPISLYCLSTESFQHNLTPLSTTLLNIVLDNNFHVESQGTYQEIAVHLIGDLDLSGSPIDRMQRCIHWLNDHKYRSHWEAFSTGPRIILDHCPYLSLLPYNPGICMLDIEIISYLTGLPMSLQNSIVKNPCWPHPCFFTHDI